MVENTSFSEKWVVGRDGYAAQSSGGRTIWTQVDVGTNADLPSIHQPSSGQVWVGAGGGVVRLKSGDQWLVRNIPSSEDFTLFSRSSGASWAAGSGGAVYKTTNGGVDWSLSHDAGVALHDGSGFVGSVAYVVGDAGTVIKTTNGGTTWTSLNTGTIADLHAFIEGGQSTGLMAVGEGGTVIRSFDQGDTWTTLDPGTSADLFEISDSGQNSAWLVAVGAGGTILKSTNGGTSWCLLNGGTDADLYGVEAVSNAEYIVCGENGLLLRTTNGGGTCQDPSALAIDPRQDLSWQIIGPVPNPVRGLATFHLLAGRGGPLTADLLHVSGRRVRHVLDRASAPGERIQFTLDTRGLDSGVYWLVAGGQDPLGRVYRSIVVVK